MKHVDLARQLHGLDDPEEFPPTCATSSLNASDALHKEETLLIFKPSS